MSKELEAFSKERQALDELYDVAGNIKNLKEDYIILKTALHRLESIDNANPSEALECLYGIRDNMLNVPYLDMHSEKDFRIIEKALLKQLEPKQYLKWEDLEFSFKDKYMKVKLNGNIYTLRYTRNALMEFPVAYLEFGNTEITIIDCKKQFFNDLHLERVEE